MECMEESIAMRKVICFLLSICLLVGCSQSELGGRKPLNDDSVIEIPEIIEKPYHEGYPPIDPVRLHVEPAVTLENTMLRNLTIYFTDAEYQLSKTQSATAKVTIGDILNAATTIELFGNSTLECAKRPLKVKFEEKQSLGDGGKKFYLISNIYDKTLLHNYVVFELARYMEGGFYVPMCEFVNVYATCDGQEGSGYQGVYLLAEKIEQNDFASYDLKYVFEQDYRVYYDDPENGVEGEDWFWMGENYLACFAVSGETSKEIVSDIKVRLEYIWKIICEKDWNKIQQYVDVENIAKSFLLDDLVKDPDVGQTSLYWGIKEDGKLCIASIWDNDLSFGCGDMGKANRDLLSLNNVIFAGLYAVPEFKEFYGQYFIAHCDEWREYINQTIDGVSAEYFDDLQNDYINWERQYNWCNEDMRTLEYIEQIEYMKEWLGIRTDFLKEQLA